MKKILTSLALAVGVLLLMSYAAWVKHRYQFSTGTSVPAFVQFMNKFDWTWYDTKFKLKPAEQASGLVMVAKIDDASLEKFGRWPWNRGIYNQILDYLYDLGAEVVSFDAVFSEPEFQERYLADALQMKLNEQQNSLREDLGLDDAKVGIFKERMPAIGDQLFASAISRHPRTVLGYAWQNRVFCPLYDPSNPEHVKEYAHENNGQPLDPKQVAEHGRLHVEEFSNRLGYLYNQGISVAETETVKPGASLYMASCPLVNRPQMSSNAKRQGFFSTDSDRDGLFRRLVLVQAFDADFVPASGRDFLPETWFKQATFFPSLALESVASYWQSPGLEVEMGANSQGQPFVKAVNIKRKDSETVRLETLPDGTLPVNFYGSQHHVPAPIPEFSLGNIEPELRDPTFMATYGLDAQKPLKGRIVIIGPTALGVYDLRPSPVQNDMPGVYLHAAAASRILEYADNPQSPVAMRNVDLRISVALMWVLGLLLALFLARASAVQGFVGILLLLTAFLGVDYYLFTRKALVLDAMAVAVAQLSIFVLTFAYKYFTEERERAFVKGAFEKYVSPDVVSDIMKDPKKLNLGGQKRELTVMFSDIRSFTTISEKMEASELAKFLNDYLSPMTDIVQENRGTIDKYMGDAIMAIFGAPVEYKNHAEKGVDAALGMLARLKELNAEWQARGLPKIDIGVGLNTGEMSVGNMGSRRIFSYTVMGDNVNLGSRLEGINKEYATHLIVSESTRTQLGPDYVCRELDRVKVKGKLKPVTIFEVMGRGELKDQRLLAQRFESALGLYYKGKFAEAQTMFMGLAATDDTSKIYVERCQMWQQEPPEADWDGSWTMKSK